MRTPAILLASCCLLLPLALLPGAAATGCAPSLANPRCEVDVGGTPVASVECERWAQYNECVVDVLGHCRGVHVAWGESWFWICGNGLP